MIWDSVVGTWGARPDRDGIDGCSNFAMNVANASVEIIESEYPVRIHRYGLRPDSGGAGRFRGGLGLVREWELLDGEATFVMRADRTRSAPWGLQGGQPGARSRNVFTSGGQSNELGSKFELHLTRGDRLLHEQASGGGHGNPLERDPQLVFHDWQNEKISSQHALSADGVLIDDGKLDLAETRRTREARVGHKGDDG